jgi:hypothetical protein
MGHYWASASGQATGLLFKQGLVDDASIRSWGASVGYDWPTVLARVACDPQVNFTADRMWRLSAGSRF